MTRTPLPNRRPSESKDTQWAGKPITICVGRDERGDVREVFADYAKVGSDAQAVIADGLVLLSLLLQHGVSITEVAVHLGRESVDPDAPAASVLGFVVAEAAGLAVSAP